MGIKQIAKLANVSIGTVDRVLHKRAGVSHETRHKVLKIIEETGYRTNMTASRLKLAATKKIKIAILIPESPQKWSYWKLPKKGILKAVEELRELGVKVDFHEFADSGSFTRKSSKILKKDYAAIVTVPFFEKESNSLLEVAQNKATPVVFLDTEIALETPAYFIRQDSFKAGMVAGRLLHGVIGNNGRYFIVNIINDKGVYANNIQREQGFRSFFESHGDTVRIHNINHPLSENLKLTPQMRNWFNEKGNKGVFVTNSRAHLLPKLFRKFEIKDTAVLGFDLNKKNLKYLRSGEIDFLINQKPEYQGYIAIKSLFDLLTKQDSSNLSLDIPVEIIVRENSF